MAREQLSFGGFDHLAGQWEVEGMPHCDLTHFGIK